MMMSYVVLFVSMILMPVMRVAEKTSWWLCVAAALITSLPTIFVAVKLFKWSRKFHMLRYYSLSINHEIKAFAHEALQNKWHRAYCSVYGNSKIHRSHYIFAFDLKYGPIILYVDPKVYKQAKQSESSSDDVGTSWIICSEMYLTNVKTNVTDKLLSNSNSNDDKGDVKTKRRTIRIYKNVSSSRRWTEWLSRLIPFHFVPTARQTAIINEIVQKSDTKFLKNHVALVYGPPGSGKSSLAAMLADQIDAVLVTDFNPFEPGQILEQLLSQIEEYKDGKKIVILIDEVDIPLAECSSWFRWFRQPHPEVRTMIPDGKKGWNEFFDMVHREVPNVIFIMTTNDKNLVRKHDKSMFRENRVDTITSLGKEDEEKEEFLTKKTSFLSTAAYYLHVTFAAVAHYLRVAFAAFA